LALTAKKVERGLKKPGRYGDGNGLYLQVTNDKNRSWIFRFERDDREYTMGLGPTHTVSLSLAREKAKAARLQLLDGVNPLLARRTARAHEAALAAKAVTFQECAEAYYQGQVAGWSVRHASQFQQAVLGRLAGGRPCKTAHDHCRALRPLLVGDIDTGAVLRVIEPMWTTATVTADRLRARIEAVLAWATVRGHRSGPNPAAWRNHLDKILPKKAKVASVKSHEAMPYPQVPEFVTKLAQRPAVAAKALMFAILTSTRSKETRGARFSECNFADATWTIPGGPDGRMKNRKEHTVPLSEPALALLRELHDGNGETDLVFTTTGKRLSEKALLMTMRRMGEPRATPHGFRASFRTWAAERTAFPEIVAEMALAHNPGTAVVRAYKRTTLFDQRRKLMDAWAAYCMSPPVVETATVLPMRPPR